MIAGGACVLGVPSKDTVKITDEEGFVESTPKRARVLEYSDSSDFLLSGNLFGISKGKAGRNAGNYDDAMVMEQYGSLKVKLEEGAYDNIKITTPEDILLAEQILETLEEE